MLLMAEFAYRNNRLFLFGNNTASNIMFPGNNTLGVGTDDELSLLFHGLPLLHWRFLEKTPFFVVQVVPDGVLVVHSSLPDLGLSLGVVDIKLSEV